MKTFLPIILLFFTVSHQALYAQSAPAEKELTQLLHQFLKGASENDAQMHDRFWAEDLTYTSSSGERFGKEQIMAGFDDETDGETAEETAPTYSAEDIQIKVYDDMAIVAFQLVGKTNGPNGTQTDRYLNSGTFIKREGQWKVVNWQATKVPEQ